MSAADPSALWVYLQASPLWWLAMTLCAYLIAQMVQKRAGGSPFVNPVAVSVVILGILLWATGTSYDTYFDGAQFVHFLLGPATVALAVPLFDNIATVRRVLLPMAVSLVIGSAAGIVTAIGIASALGATRETLLSLAPKSATTPIAMGITEKLGGVPSLTAAMVILTGIIGAIAVTPLLALLRVRDQRAMGFGIGVAAHGIGTTRAFQIGEIAGLFSGIGMAFNGMMTALLVPLLIGLF